MIKYKTLFYLLNLALIITIFIYWIWVFNKYKYTKGDPFLSPPYKKTFYLNKEIFSQFNFTYFFNKIEKSIKNNGTIKYYEWILHYDEMENMFWKAELICFYKIGTKKTVMNFEWEKLYYTDKTGVTHLSVDLIYKRNMENFLAAELKMAENVFPTENSDFEEIKTKKGHLIGYNIKIGILQYKIKKYKNRKSNLTY